MGQIISKKQIKSLLSRFYISNTKDILAAMQSAAVVSFDIFDTLIKRDVPSPRNVHILVDRKYAEQTGRTISDYPMRRLLAEQEARKASSDREITLKDIFSHFAGLTKEDREILFQLEIRTEYEVCCANLYIKPLYDQAVALGKRVVITSDMYLPERVIKGILRKCGIEHCDKLYLSSARGVTKASGKLFDVLLEEQGESAGRIVHIGDDVKGDYYRPRERGIRACLIDAKQKRLCYWKMRDMKTREQQFFYSFLNNHKPADGTDFACDVGYEVLGPMLWGFCIWLNRRLKELRPDKVFFLSREGALLRRAYQILYPDCPFPQEYLYVSRQALQVPLLEDCRTYGELLELLKPLMHTHSMENVGKTLRLDARYEEGIRAMGLDPGDDVLELPRDRQKPYLKLVFDLGNEYFTKQHDLVQKYLRQSGFCGKTAVVDIGWQGTMQKALARYAEGEAEVTGFYYGVRDARTGTSGKRTDLRGYLFEPGRNEDWNLKFRFTNEILETLFLNGAGSVTHYALSKGGSVIPVLTENEQERAEQELLDQMQEAACRFLSDKKKQGLEPVLADTIMLGYERFAVKPALKTLRRVQDFRFTDGGSSKILPQHPAVYYLMRPWKLGKDMNASSCKIFFLKGILKLPLPYFGILKFLLLNMKIKSRYQKNMEKTGGA